MTDAPVPIPRSTALRGGRRAAARRSGGGSALRFTCGGPSDRRPARRPVLRGSGTRQRDRRVDTPRATGQYAAMSDAPPQYALGSLFGPGRAELVEHVPHAHVLGIRVVEIGPAFAVCALPYRDELIGDPQRRVVFGGAITTLIDHTSGLAVACALEQLTTIATIDLRVDYLRAATPGLELFARSDCYRV